VRTRLVSGKGFVTVDLPDEAVLVEAELSAPLPPVPDLAQAVRQALDAPLDLPPLTALAKPGMRVTVAFDDPTVPCYAPVWITAISAVVADLVQSGVALDAIQLVCANALHRQFTEREPADLP
jgi:nickel-dependent lactate racemase